MGLRVTLRVLFVVFFVSLHNTITKSPCGVPRAKGGPRISCMVTYVNVTHGTLLSFGTSVALLESVPEDGCLSPEHGPLRNSGYRASCARHSDETRTRSAARIPPSSEALPGSQLASHFFVVSATWDCFGEKGLNVSRLGRIDLAFYMLISRNVTRTGIVFVQRVLSVERDRLEPAGCAALVQWQVPSQRHEKGTACRQNTAGGNTCTDAVSSFILSEAPVTKIAVAIDSLFARFPNISVLTSRELLTFESCPRNRTIMKWRPDRSKKRTNESADVTEMPDDKDFPHPHPHPHKRFLAVKVRDFQFQAQSHTSGMATPHSNTEEVFFNVILTVVCLCFLRLVDERERKASDSAVVLRLLTKSFFQMSRWTHQRQPYAALVKSRRGTKVLNDSANSSSPYSSRHSSLLGSVLSDYIFRPWLWKSRRRAAPRPCSSRSKSSGCYSSDSRLCRSYRAHLDSFRRMGPREIQLAPVTRFLPDATRNPDVDLAHVGYRLATLSALPPSVPVSRIRLADAGFYFRGHGDEVTCYSCRVRHAGWTSGDNPMEVHRRLSPRCEHVARRDRELSAVASLGRGALGSAGGPPGTGPQPGSPSPWNGASVAGGGHVEDGGDVPRETSTPFPQPPELAPREPPTPPRHGVSAGTVASDSAGRAAEGRRPGSSTATATGTTGTTSPSTNAGARPVGSSSSRLPPGASGANSSSNNSSSSLFPRAALDLGGAVYPMYQDMASRRRTFSHWDDNQAPPLDHVILCGMFYAGYADCVRCFYCGVGLKHWVASDDVWTEHVRWRPGCEYLRAVKGDHFIRETQRRLGIGDTPRDPNPSQAASHRQQPTTTTVTAPAAVSTTTQRYVTTSATTATTSVRQPTPAASASAAASTAVGGVGHTSTTGSTPATQTSGTVSTAATTAGSGGYVAAATVSLPAATAAASSSSGRGSGANQGGGGNGSGQRGASVTAVSSAAEDADRLAELQAENRALSQRLGCRVCQAPINTILLPCGHLVVCENCARTVTSCPLCHDTIRATARV